MFTSVARLSDQAVADEPAKKVSAAVIDASKYADLQAAFDAVPEAGGLVKLPPGDFKLRAARTDYQAR
jgi:hypothetical protein